MDETPPLERRFGLQAIRSLDYTMLICDDVDRMRAFYVDVLGLPVAREVPGRYVELAAGAATIAIRQRSRSYDGASTAGSAGVQLCFRVAPSDVGIAAEQLEHLGIDLLEPVQELDDFGHRVVFVADPEGNIVEIYAEV